MICCDSCRYTRMEGLENAVHHFVVFKRNLPLSGPAFPSCSYLSAHVPPRMSFLRSFKCCSLQSPTQIWRQLKIPIKPQKLTITKTGEKSDTILMKNSIC